MESNGLHTTRYTTPPRHTQPYRTGQEQRPVHQLIASRPVHRTLLVVDIENSTSRRDPIKAQLRQVLYRILDEALRTSGISQTYRDPLVDRGDGILLLIRPADHLPKSSLFTTLVPALDHLVERHNEDCPRLALRLRIAIHAGEIHHDTQGPFGEAIDLTCRLLDSPELKAALNQTTSSTALAVSEHLYDVIIKHQYDGIDATMYSRQLRVDFAGAIRQGWLRTDRFATSAQSPIHTPAFQSDGATNTQFDDRLETITSRPRVAPFRRADRRNGQIVDTRPPSNADTKHSKP
jgi:class 3 adenylate cyclase